MTYFVIVQKWVQYPARPAFTNERVIVEPRLLYTDHEVVAYRINFLNEEFAKRVHPVRMIDTSILEDLLPKYKFKQMRELHALSLNHSEIFSDCWHILWDKNSNYIPYTYEGFDVAPTEDDYEQPVEHRHIQL